MPLHFQKWNVTSIMSCLNSDHSFHLAMSSQDVKSTTEISLGISMMSRYVGAIYYYPLHTAIPGLSAYWCMHTHKFMNICIYSQTKNGVV